MATTITDQQKAINSFFSTISDNADELGRRLDFLMVHALHDEDNPPDSHDMVILIEIKKLLKAIEPITQS